MTNLVEKWFDKLGDRIGEEGARVRAVVEAGLAQTANGLRVTGARPQPILPNAVNAGRGRLVGWSLRETAGAGAVVTCYSGRDTGADVLATIPLPANAGSTELPGGPGVFFGDGMYVAVTGAVTGAFYYGAHD